MHLRRSIDGARLLSQLVATATEYSCEACHVSSYVPHVSTWHRRFHTPRLGSVSRAAPRAPGAASRATMADAPAIEEPTPASESASQSNEPSTAAEGAERATEANFKDAVDDDWQKLMAARAQKQDTARFAAEAENDPLHSHRYAPTPAIPYYRPSSTLICVAPTQRQASTHL